MAKAYFRKDTRTWYVLHKKEKIKVGRSKRAAKHLADKINLEEAEGSVGLHKLNEKSIESFFEEILTYKKNIRDLKQKSLTRYQGIIRNFLNFLKIKFPTVIYLSQLDLAIFESYIRYRKTTPFNKNGTPVTDKQIGAKKDGNLKIGVSDKTIKIEIGTLKSMLQYAVKSKDPRKRYLRDNPLEYLEQVRVKDQKQKRPLTQEEVIRFLVYMKEKDKELYEIFFSLLHTGMRDGELRHLELKET